jgi:hypothetical protein
MVNGIRDSRTIPHFTLVLIMIDKSLSTANCIAVSLSGSLRLSATAMRDIERPAQPSIRGCVTFLTPSLYKHSLVCLIRVVIRPSSPSSSTVFFYTFLHRRTCSTMHPFGGTPICPRCSKAVYAAEQVSFVGLCALITG